jgi:hypothetical protein
MVLSARRQHQVPTEREYERIGRMQDFERRAAYAPSSVRSHPEGWRYIAVHDFGGSSMDAYWCTGADAYLLQAWTLEHDARGRAPGLYFRWSRGSPSLFVLVGVVDARAIDLGTLEHVMSQFAPLLPPETRPPSLSPFSV